MIILRVKQEFAKAVHEGQADTPALKSLAEVFTSYGVKPEPVYPDAPHKGAFHFSVVDVELETPLMNALNAKAAEGVVEQAYVPAARRTVAPDPVMGGLS